MTITGPIMYFLSDPDGRELEPGGSVGLPWMRMTVNGIETQVPVEQKLLLGYGAVFIGPQAEGETSFAIPPQVEGNAPKIVPGMTTDPVAVRLVREFIAAVGNGTFRPGEVHPAGPVSY